MSQVCVEFVSSLYAGFNLVIHVDVQLFSRVHRNFLILREPN